MGKPKNKFLSLITLLVFTFVGSDGFSAGDDNLVKTIGGRVYEIGKGDPVRNGSVKLFKVENENNIFVSEVEIQSSGAYIFKELNFTDTDEFRIMAYPSDEIENDNELESTPVIKIKPELVVNQTFYYNVYVDWETQIQNVKLYQNFPNPFNPFTIIECSIPFDAMVDLSVFDARGRLIQVLSNGFEYAGEKRVTFNGNGLSSGVYFCRIKVGGKYQDYKLMTLLK